MNSEAKRALITGASQRIGKAICESLHAQGYAVLIHYRSNTTAAQDLCEELNNKRPDSADAVRADLCSNEDLQALIRHAQNWGPLDLLINNAASFYPDSAGNPLQFLNNASQPYELAMALSTTLKERNGVVINLLDIYANNPKKGFAHYSASKAAAQNYTLSLARHLAPQARANGIAPGAILWPEDEQDKASQQQQILDQIPLARTGSPDDIVKAVWFLIDSTYITGQVIAVDGGRSLNL